MIISVCSLFAQTELQKSQIEQLRKELAKAKTPKDSILILYDIFDLSPRSDYITLSHQLYNTAGRAGDISSQLDIIRQATAVIKDENAYSVLEQELMKLPQTDERDETLLFIKMKRLSHKSFKTTPEQLKKEVANLIVELESKTPSTDREKFMTLFTVVEYLRNSASSDMLEHYMAELNEAAESSTFSLYAIPNIVYAESANTYTLAEDAQKAIEAEKNLLTIIDGLEKEYAQKGRKYRNYDVSRFVSYRRMLRNYKALKPEEIESIYQKIDSLSKLNTDVARDLQTNPYTMGYYYALTGNHKEAIPLLKSAVEHDKPLTFKKMDLELLAKSVKVAGDDKMLIDVLEHYIDVLNEIDKVNTDSHYAELQISYDIRLLRNKDAALELENREKDLVSARKLMNFIIICFLLIPAAMIACLWYWTRFRRNHANQIQIANRLTQERDLMLESSSFTENPDHLPEHNYSFMEWSKRKSAGFKKRNDFSILLTLRIMNDLLEIAMLARNYRLKYITRTSVDSIMRSTEAKLNEDTEGNYDLSVEFPETDYKFLTDEDSLVHVLAHILINIISETPHGNQITFSYERGNDNLIRFIFSSPHDFSCAELFNDTHSFINSHDLSDGPTTGIFIDRMIALLLVAEIMEDKTTGEGTRLIFTIPENLML